MVLTGVETVGVVLAVFPLFITLLENHKAETQPFFALLRHQKALTRATQELQLGQNRYTRVIQLVVEDLALPPSQKSLLLKNALSAGDAPAWTHPDVEQALIESFGEVHYKHGFLLLLEKVRKGVLDISAVLGLDLTMGSTDAVVRWVIALSASEGKLVVNRIVLISNEKEKAASKSKRAQRASFFLEAWKRKGEGIRDRVNFVLKSGTLEEKRQRLREYTEDLEKDRSGAKELLASRLPAPRFKWPLLDLRKLASNLFKALKAVKDCAIHSSHCVKIQLDCRLHGLSQGWRGFRESKPVFTVALGSANNVSAWHAMHVALDTEGPSPWEPGRRARFPREDTEPRRLVENGVCVTLSRSRAVSFCVDSENRLHEVSAPPESAVILWPSTEWVPMRALLDAAHHSKNFASTCDEAMQLGLTLACSYLQLMSTEWISDNWTSADVKFLRNAAPGDDLAYITATLADTPMSPAGSVGSGAKHGLSVLAALLFELGSNKSIPQCRRPEDSTDVGTIKRCLKMLHGQPPCFIEAVEYCLDFQDQNTELELTNKATLQKIAAAVVAPFQRDLQSSRMAAPSSGKAWQFISLEAGVREVIAASGIGETQML